MPSTPTRFRVQNSLPTRGPTKVTIAAPLSPTSPPPATARPAMPVPTTKLTPQHDQRSRILVVDDDATFRGRLARALTSRGLEAFEAGEATLAMALARRVMPGRAIIDLRMPGKGGLELLAQLHALSPQMQIVVLTGYGSIATAVEAVRRGAVDYLSKPVDTEQILAAFDRDGSMTSHAVEFPSATGSPAAALAARGASGSLPATTIPSLARVEWEHVQRILTDCGGNISQAARKLGIHRRSLQRKLGKLPPLE